MGENGVGCCGGRFSMGYRRSITVRRASEQYGDSGHHARAKANLEGVD